MRKCNTPNWKFKSTWIKCKQNCDFIILFFYSIFVHFQFLFPFNVQISIFFQLNLQLNFLLTISWYWILFIFLHENYNLPALLICFHFFQDQRFLQNFIWISTICSCLAIFPNFFLLLYLSFHKNTHTHLLLFARIGVQNFKSFLSICNEAHEANDIFKFICLVCVQCRTVLVQMFNVHRAT